MVAGASVQCVIDLRIREVQRLVNTSVQIVNYPRIHAGASGFIEVITSNILHRLKIGQFLPY